MKKINLAISGCMGRMGQQLIKSSKKNKSFKLITLTENRLVNKKFHGIKPELNSDKAFKKTDVIIDFTVPKCTLEILKIASKLRKKVVIGTTGFTRAQENEIKKYSKKIPILKAGNMSLGVNLLTLLTKKISAVLDEDFDIEIVESHHRHKVDAPSGTALMLGHAAAEGRGVKLLNVEDRGRDGINGARTRGDIGFHAIRGGDVVGEHDVIFAADGERIVLRHLATDRQIFVRGALRAAIWAQDKDAGEYDMMDVLGL